MSGEEAPAAPKLDRESILAAGEDRAGLAADRRGNWVAALGRLVSSASGEGGLTDAGADAFATTLATFVDERLRAEALLASHPDIAARPLPVRFAVAGLARSGTTVLHRLLSCDPDVAFLPTWQAMRPVPSQQSRPDEDPRRDAVRRYIDDLAVSRPEAFRMHPLDADAPEEEVFLLQHSFASMLFGLICPLPSYNDWLIGTDHHAAYSFALDMVRLNEWAAASPSGRPRVMKSPQFALDLAVVLDVAPDAVIAQTHRDPVDLVGSYCSIYANSRRRSVVDVDPIALGRERLAHLGAMADRATAARDAADPNRFVDVHYADLTREPLSVVDALYDRAGVTLRAAARRAMQEWLDDNPQHKGGRHDYRLADYGLDRDTIEATLGPYLERFKVRRDDDAR